MPSKDLPVHAELLPRPGAKDGISVREDTLYTNHKGVEKNRLRKDADTAFARLKDVFAKVLEPDETVLYLAPAQAPVSVVQQFTLGWMTYSLTRAMLVVTNRRVLDIHLKPKAFRRWEWGRGIRSIRLGDLADAKVRPGIFNGTLHLRYADGVKEKFWRLRPGDARKIRLLLQVLLPASVGEASAARAPVSLCPNCFAVLAPKQERCNQCQLAFATDREIIRRSLLFPGGGYFYVGQPTLGILDAWVESVILFWLVIWLLVVAGFSEPFRGPLDQESTGTAALFVAGFFAVVLAMEKLFTIYHARHFTRGFYPLDKPPNQVKWTVLGVAAYALILSAAWAVIPPPETPLMTVASDVVIYRADFGVFNALPNRSISFTPTSTVPRTPGQLYGFVLRLRTPRPPLKMSMQFVLGPEPDEALPPIEATTETAGEVIARYWEVEPDEPRGRQTLKVTLEGVSVGNFHFTVR